jgi:phage FluMu protein Com
MSSSPCSAVTARSEASKTTERRCECGKLLAKVTQAGLELKCSRCRRVVVIPWQEVSSEGDP